jgi:hypothetical protein
LCLNRTTQLNLIWFILLYLFKNLKFVIDFGQIKFTHLQRK